MKTIPRRLYPFYLALFIFWTGCATVPYRQGVSFEDPRLPEAPQFESQIVRGRPNRILDNADWVWPGSWLGKLVLWDRRVDNHRIGEETEEMMHRYLAHNELDHVKVRLNMYAPGDEFRRTVRNRSVGAGWRYTVGMLVWVRYTVLPGRIFGGDHYNPYSNTIHLYSDIPAIAVHEGGHAKDFADRRWKGTYAFAYAIPFVNLYHEALASNDALGYLIAEESPEAVAEGYRIMHPAYGTYAGGNAGLLIPEYALPVYAGAVIAGHATGRLTGRRIASEMKAEETETATQP